VTHVARKIGFGEQSQTAAAPANSVRWTPTATMGLGELEPATWPIFVAQVLTACKKEEFCSILGEGLQSTACATAVFFMQFEDESDPKLLYSNLSGSKLQLAMQWFRERVHVLDPLGGIARHPPSCLYRAGIEPVLQRPEHKATFSDFLSTENELRLIIYLSERTSIHIVLTRKNRAESFSEKDVASLVELSPFVKVVVENHFGGEPATSFNVKQNSPTCLRNLLRIFRNGALTAREIDIVELILRGKSSKTIARALDIQPGTVTNHKRNIYCKLAIESQGQLFDILLSEMGVT